MKKIYLHPELREKPLTLDGDVLNYDDDFWS